MDNDLDTISPFIELAGHNGGDANGDSQLDAIQNDVSSIPNIENTFYNSLQIE